MLLSKGAGARIGPLCAISSRLCACFVPLRRSTAPTFTVVATSGRQAVDSPLLTPAPSSPSEFGCKGSEYRAKHPAPSTMATMAARKARKDEVSTFPAFCKDQAPPDPTLLQMAHAWLRRHTLHSPPFPSRLAPGPARFCTDPTEIARAFVSGARLFEWGSVSSTAADWLGRVPGCGCNGCGCN